MSAQSEDAREADVDCRRKGMKQLPDRQEATEDRPPGGRTPAESSRGPQPRAAAAPPSTQSRNLQKRGRPKTEAKTLRAERAEQE